MAYDVLNHIFDGNLTKPGQSVPLTGQFITFDQAALMSPESVELSGVSCESIFSYWANWLKISIGTSKLPGSVDITSTNSSSFDKEGYVYYPKNCVNQKKCPIHVALHGCLQGLYNFSLTNLAHLFS